VIAPNRDGGQPADLGVGQEVLLTWDPQHTFVVARDV
jgi:spermidine/putrescine transport system ATP-binding protein